MTSSAAQPSAALIEFHAVSKTYGSGQAAVQALAGIDMRIDAGEFVAIMGPSGSGKSTAMNILGCLDTPSQGQYLFGGVDVGRLDRDQRALLRRNFLGFVFQGYNLLARNSAVENVELPLVYRGVAPTPRRGQALAALNKVGLENWADHLPAELSGGQQQRVAIARALINTPTLLLADEPTGNLDEDSGQAVISLLTGLARDQGTTMLIVTHSSTVAAAADHVLRLQHGQLRDA